MRINKLKDIKDIVKSSNEAELELKLGFIGSTLPVLEKIIDVENIQDCYIEATKGTLYSFTGDKLMDVEKIYILGGDKPAFTIVLTGEENQNAILVYDHNDVQLENGLQEIIDLK